MSLEHHNRNCLAWIVVIGCLSLYLALAHEVGLETRPRQVDLSVGAQIWRFNQVGEGWALAVVEVAGKPVAKPLARTDSFFIGGGEASGFAVLSNSPQTKSLRFFLGTNSATYTVDARAPLPIMRIRWERPATAGCAFRTVAEAPDEHGAWVTRGYVATDADAHEDFIDASRPMVFGHSTAGSLDAGYLFVPTVNPHIQRNGRSEQRSDTWFKSARQEAGDGRFYSVWRLRMGRTEPKECAVLFDRDLGGRLSDVCEKHFAGAVDSLVDLMYADTSPRVVDVDVRHARMLMLRMSCNWDDNGNSKNDYGDWAEARLVGKTSPEIHP